MSLTVKIKSDNYGGSSVISREQTLEGAAAAAAAAAGVADADAGSNAVSALPGGQRPASCSVVDKQGAGLGGEAGSPTGKMFRGVGEKQYLWQILEHDNPWSISNNALRRARWTKAAERVKKVRYVKVVDNKGTRKVKVDVCKGKDIPTKIIRKKIMRMWIDAKHTFLNAEGNASAEKGMGAMSAAEWGDERRKSETVHLEKAVRLCEASTLARREKHAVSEEHVRAAEEIGDEDVQRMISEGEGSAGRRENAGVSQGAGRSAGSRRNAGGGQGAGLRGQGGYGCGAAIYGIYDTEEDMTIDFQLETIAKGFPVPEEMIEGWEEELFGDLEEDWEEQFEEQLDEDLSSDDEEGYSKAWGERMQDLARKALARRVLARKAHQGAGGRKRRARYSFDDDMGMDRQGARGRKRKASNGNSCDDGVHVNQQGTGGRNRRAPAGDSVADGVGTDQHGRKGRAPTGNSSGVGADTDPWAVLATVEKRLTQKMDGDRSSRIAVQRRLDRMEAEQDRLKAEQKRLNEVVLVNLDNLSGKIGSLSKALSEVQAAVFSAHPPAYSAPQPPAYGAPLPHMAHMAPNPWLGVQPGFLPAGAAMGSGGVPRPHPDAGGIPVGFQHQLPFYRNAGAAAAGVESVQQSAIHLQQGGPAAGGGDAAGLQEGEAPPVLEWENAGAAGEGWKAGNASAD